MKLLVALVLAFGLVSCDLESEWEKFQASYGRPAARGLSGPSKINRKANFEKTYEEVQQWNKEYEEGKRSYKMTFNKFADWTEEEKRAILRPDNIPPPAPQSIFASPSALKKRDQELIRSASVPVPDFKDWSKEGKVSPIKDQGGCMSCWAFGAAAAIESMMLIKYNYTVSLSEQNLVDCVDQKYGRNPVCGYGGWPAWAYKWIIESGGVNSDRDYPYTMEDGECKHDMNKFYVNIAGYVAIPPGDEEEMKRVVGTIGPISVDIDARWLYNLGDGLYDHPDCNKEHGNHIVTIVGYGTTEDGDDYWLIKNSYGEGWGVNGLGKVRRGVNACAIAMHADYPVR